MERVVVGGSRRLVGDDQLCPEQPARQEQNQENQGGTTGACAADRHHRGGPSTGAGLPPEQAFHLFTPSGERAWTEGWDPQFPTAVADETEPGTVFTTDHGGRSTIWTVVHREAGTDIAYSRTTPGDRAGLVTVALQPTVGGSTVTVGYDLTALVPEADHALQEFAHHYPAFLAEWRDAIAAFIAAPHDGRAHHARP